jgi:hypothetical protein
MEELLVKIGQIRRRTRNLDVLEMCDVLEGMLGIRHRAALERPPSPWRNPETGKFDKRAYMREYMRRRRGSKNPKILLRLPNMACNLPMMELADTPEWELITSLPSDPEQ